MPPRSTSRSTAIRTRASVAASLVAALAVTLLGALSSAPAYAANPVTPGTFKGLGFDQCEAPSQSAMSAWIKHSPFKAAGIYISGNSRGFRSSVLVARDFRDDAATSSREHSKECMYI